MGLVVSCFLLASLFNVARTLLLTRVAASKGIATMSKWHDPAGTLILVACFIVLWALAIWLRAEPTPTSGAQAPQSPSTVHFFNPSRALQWTAALLLIWLIAVETGTELWYRSHERANAVSTHWKLGAAADRASQFTRLDISKEISSQFRYDQGTELRWQDPDGNAWQLYYLRWLPGCSLKNRVAMQLAKSHGPEICMPAAGMTLEESLGAVTLKVKGNDLALEQFRFSFQGRSVHVFYGLYEDPTGTGLANRRMDSTNRLKAALAGSRNYGQRFVEFAVSGPESSQSALAALESQLALLFDAQ
jgi:hypothetical protein